MNRINSTRNTFWLDSVFLSKPTNLSSLEEQMNTISKMIVFSFFILVLYFPLKTAAAFSLCMLFTISLLYYYLDGKMAIKEGFEEAPPTKQKTYLNVTNVDRIVDTQSREVYIPSRQMNQVQYKTILPLYSYTLQSEPVKKHHPDVLNSISPKENLFSQSQEEQDLKQKPKSFLTFTESSPQKEFKAPPDMEVFRRSNIDHLPLHQATARNDFSEIDRIYMENQLLLRENYENQIKHLNQVRDEHYKIAPIHQNYRVQGFGGGSHVANYAGPRGNIR